MVKLYHVHLSDDDRTRLEQVISRGRTTARVSTRARILLKAAEGWHDEEIVDAVGGSVPTVARVRRRFVEGGSTRSSSTSPSLVAPVPSPPSRPPT